LVSFIPEDKITEIRDACNIVEVVGETVLLKKAGKNYAGLCPFHAEKTPSFTVSPDKQMFYCFGCGEGGNVFSFLMKQHGMPFPEAVKMLAERTGISLPAGRPTREQKRQRSEQEAILELNHLTMGLYRKTFQRDTRGQAARDYLGKRGFQPEVLDTFQIGFAPEGWDNLTRYFQRQGHTLAVAEKAGLVARRKQGQGYYDRFRNRIIFPIIDHRHRVIAFGGRVLDDSLPKYLNSPETAVYHKSRSLYGLNIAQSHCRTEERVYIVEGYLDVMALHQHGVPNAVGTLGTALTREHVRMLRGYIGPSGHAILVFDSDEAGIKAAHRSIGVFAQEFVEARILVLPPGHDPDTFMMTFGPRAFRDMAGNAKGIMPFMIDTAIERHGSHLEGRIKVLEELAEPMAVYDDPVARSVYVKYLAEKVDIDEAAVLEKLRQAAGKTPSGRPSGVNPGRHAAAETRALSLADHSRIERQLVAMMLQFPEILPEIRNQDVLRLIEDPILKRIGQEVLGDALRPNEMERVSNRDAADDINRVKARLSLQEENWEIKGCINFIRQFKASKRAASLKELDEKIRRAEKNNDFEQLSELLRERNLEAIEHDREKVSGHNKPI
jgi:DNA primase